MSPDAKKLLEDALRLPAEARAALAGSLIQSLDTEPDPDAEKAWANEIGRRVREVEDGTVELIPWDEARKRLESRIAARRR